MAEPPPLPHYTLRRSHRARYLRIQVTPREGVVLVLPRGVAEAQGLAFLQERRRWIERSLERLGLDPACPPRIALPEVIRLPVLGAHCPVLYRPGPGAPRARGRADDRIVVEGTVEDEAATAQALRRWLRRIARPLLERELASLSAATGLAYRRLAVRSQRTLWGSCSSSGTISLNCKLLFLDPELLRYVVVHELAHTRHMNHSRRFWSLVARFEPEHRAREAALREATGRVPSWVDG
jgi:predicted metal-dependent hydrolase